MGITIHHRFAKKEHPRALLEKIEARAISLGMKIEGKSSNGFLINPGETSEWLDLRWYQWRDLADKPAISSDETWLQRMMMEPLQYVLKSDDWICAGFAKTQFAGVDCHAKVCEILRLAASQSWMAMITDEGGYYELPGDKGLKNARQVFDESNKAMAEMAATLKKCGAANCFVGLGTERWQVSSWEKIRGAGRNLWLSREAGWASSADSTSSQSD